MKNRILYVASLFALVLLGACDTLLEPIDENHLSSDYIDTDPAFAEGLLLTAYKNVVSPYDFLDVATDDAVSNQLSNGYNTMATGELSAANNAASRWGRFSDVFYLNKFLAVIDDVTWNREPIVNELFVKRLKGEALALRGLFHFYAFQAHAGQDATGQLLGVPYYTEFIASNGNFNAPRETFEETLRLINQDFDQAISLLPMDYSDDEADKPAAYDDYSFDDYQLAFGAQNNLRITARIIKAFKARMLLWAASPAFLDGNYDAVANLSAELINDKGGITYFDNNGLVFYDDDNDKNADEILWRASINQSSWMEANHFPPSLNGSGQVNPSMNLVDAFPMLDGYPRGESTTYTYDATQPFANRDPRLAHYILYNGGVIGSNTIGTGTGNGIDGINNTQGKSTRTGFYLKKLLRPDVQINNDGSTIDKDQIQCFFRYTELYLILAESANEIGGPDHQVGGMNARAILAAIRSRAGIDQPDVYLSSISSKEQMRQLIRNERRLELCFEGQRFWDLRRWDVSLSEAINGSLYDDSYKEIEVEARQYPDYARYMPIPHTEIQKYSELKQNINW